MFKGIDFCCIAAVDANGAFIYMYNLIIPISKNTLEAGWTEVTFRSPIEISFKKLAGGGAQVARLRDLGCTNKDGCGKIEAQSLRDLRMPLSCEL